MSPHFRKGPLSRAGFIGLLAFAAACHDDASAPSIPPRIAVVSGNNQEVRDGSPLGNPLAVRVTGTGGRPVGGIQVVWEVTRGAGEFYSFPDDQHVTPAVSVTGDDGVARIDFFPAVIGQTEVSASAREVASAAATFYVNDRPKFEIVFGPFFDCTPFTDPSRFSLNNSNEMVSQVNVPTSLSYYHGLNNACTARVKTTSVPEGGEAFDTGILTPGEVFMFTPRVAGTWELTDVVNGGSGLLIVR